MLIGIMGKMGAGKTLTQSILACYLAGAYHVPLIANYDLEGSRRITSVSEMWELDSAVIAWDEIWLSLDARLWTDNVFVTRFINQTRKKKLVLFYTTQHIRQVEMRVRNGTDILIYCEKKPTGHVLTFIDWQYQSIGRKIIIPHEAVKPFYDLYNTYEVLEPLSMPKPAPRGNFERKKGSSTRYQGPGKPKEAESDEF